LGNFHYYANLGNFHWETFIWDSFTWEIFVAPDWPGGARVDQPFRACKKLAPDMGDIKVRLA